MSAVKYKCKFLDEWLSNEKFQLWVKRVDSDCHSAYCTSCKKKFSIAGQGVKQLESHMKSDKHQQKSPPDSDRSKQKTLHFQPVDKTGETDAEKEKESKKVQQTLDKTVLSDDVTKSEIMWALEVLRNNYSYRSCANKSTLFATMFHDSKIARNFKLGKTKCSYVLCHGIAPYCNDVLHETLKKTTYLVVLFDESYNSSVKKGQMDMHVRFWNDKTQRVTTRYFNSEFLGKAAADDVYNKFDLCCTTLERNKFIQVKIILYLLDC